jgi:hypothetical protein
MSIYKVTNLLECTEIQIPENAFFGTKKSGYVRLVRDDHKRAYIIQLFDSISTKNTENAKPKFENEVFEF